MLDTLISIIKKDYKMAMLIITMYALYELSSYMKTFIDKNNQKLDGCEEEKKEMQKKLDSANTTILHIYQLKSIKNDTN